MEKAPFLIDRMKIQILPCLVGFVDGISVDRLVGFEELGNLDTFPTSLLEKRLCKCKVLESSASNLGFSLASSSSNYNNDEDDDDDY